MKIKSIIKKYIFDESMFRYIYILSLFFSFMCIVEVPAQVVTYVSMAWAAILIVRKLYYKSSRITYLPLLIAFIISGCVTAFLHIHDNFWMNMLMMLHVTICFFIFYSLFTEDNKEKLHIELDRIFIFIVKASTIFSIIGIIIAIAFPMAEVLGYQLGLFDNRYTGLYTNPNLSAFISVIAIIFCMYLIKDDSGNKYYNKIPRWLAVSCIASNFLTLLLSDSNSSLIFLLIYIFAYCCCNFYRRYCNIHFKMVALKSIALLMAFIVLSGCTYFLRLSCQNGMAFVMNNAHDIEYEVSGSGDNSTNLISLGRANEDRDITSGRTDSWGKSMILIEENPIMGIGKGNITEYANRYLARGLNFSDLHNGYLTILVSTGVVGFSIFLIFSIMIARRIILCLLEKLRHNKGEKLAILFSMMCAYCVYSFFEKALLFDITFMVVIFWLVLGYSVDMIPARESMAINNIKHLFVKFKSSIKK